MLRSLEIVRLRSNAAAAEFCAVLRRDESRALAAVAPASAYDVARIELAIAIADAAQAQAEEARGRLIRALAV